jgi:hypothetical protein
MTRVLAWLPEFSTAADDERDERDKQNGLGDLVLKVAHGGRGQLPVPFRPTGDVSEPSPDRHRLHTTSWVSCSADLYRATDLLTTVQARVGTNRDASRHSPELSLSLHTLILEM